MVALALPAGEAVGRIGCFFNGCCYGTVCSTPWAVYQHGAWRHPVQIYSAVTAALIFGSLLGVRKWLTREGDLFMLYLVAFGATRFGLEFLRQNDTFWLGLTPMQWLCLELIVYGTLTLMSRKRQPAPSK
ncbi:MAG: prolipoprotein diacylglyceryl transferase [Fimbriimonadales bacterium]